MRKITQLFISLFVFTLFSSLFVANAYVFCDADHGEGWVCTEGLTEYQCLEVGGHYYEVIENDYNTGCYISSGYSTVSLGSCCEPPPSEEVVLCPTGEYCSVQAKNTCGLYGAPGYVRNCSDEIGPFQEGCCLPEKQIKCEDEIGDGYFCGSIINDCEGMDVFGPYQCADDGSIGCCYFEGGERVDCADGWGCRQECPSVDLGRYGGCVPTNCGPSGQRWYCVVNYPDEGQVFCEDGWGCRQECPSVDLGRYGGCIPTNCGSFGAEGYCVAGYEDEEFGPDEDRWTGEALNRDVRTLFRDIELDVQVASLYNVLFPIAIFISVAMIIVAGYTYLTSTGNPDKVRDATQKLTSAITGAVFIILSLTILRVIINLLLK